MNNENSDSIINMHKNIGANIRYFRKKSNLIIEQLNEKIIKDIYVMFIKNIIYNEVNQVIDT